ncbi:MAG: hypothetical protein ACREI2_07855, partial [Nitrospiraceae bacterium]
PDLRRAPLTFKSGQTVAQPVAKGNPTVPPIVRPVLARASQIPFKTSKNIFAPLEVQAAEERVARAKSRKRVEEPPKEAQPSEPVAAPTAVPVSPPPPSPEEVAAQLARQQQELARQQLEQAEQQARQQNEQAAQQARQQMAQYRFLGYLTQQGEHRAFLGKGQALFIVRIGETVEGKIQVAAIDPSAVKLREVVTNVETTLPLTKSGGGPS